MIAAQGIIFFAAGSETTASTLATTCYYLAKNPKVQEKAFKEIQEVIQRHNGVINYETIKDLHYLEAVVAEDLRIAPPVMVHSRLCTKDCEVI